MNAKMRTEIRRHVESALGELAREMATQGDKTFKFSISDYAGGLTLKLEEVDLPAAPKAEGGFGGFALGAAALGSAPLADDPEETPEDGDE